MKNKEKIYQIILNECMSNHNLGIDTVFIANKLGMRRSNVSKILNTLVEQGKLKKKKGKPVLYYPYDQESSCFDQLTCHDKCLKEPIKLAKAALSYPNRKLSTLMISQEGDIFEVFVEKMIEFSCNFSGDQRKKFIDISIHDFNYDIANQIRNHEFILIQNLHEADKQEWDSLKRFLNKTKEQYVIARMITKELNQLQSDNLEIFDVVINLPEFSDLTNEERFEFISNYLQKESLNVNRSIQIEGNLLACLLLYKCERNLKQLENDIRIMCASAYVRQKQGLGMLYITANDLQSHVRKGLLHVEKNHIELKNIIDDRKLYIFSDKEIRTDLIEKKHVKTFYQFIDERIQELEGQGYHDDEIQSMLKDDIQNELKIYTQGEIGAKFDENKLSKLVDQPIIDLTRNFLGDASNKLHQIFSSDVYYGLCLHINALIHNRVQKRMYDQKYYLKFISENEAEYELVSNLANSLHHRFDIEISEEEKLYLTLFLIKDSKIEFSKPSILVAMHGDGIATSICRVVKSFISTENIYPFDMQLELETEEIYNRLKRVIKRIDNGKGIIAIYDMGSLRFMLQELSEELTCNIKLIELPVTAMILDITRNVENGIEIQEKGFVDLYTNRINENHVNRHEQVMNRKKYSIITMCMSGYGGAEQIKSYIKHNVDIMYFKELSIIPLSAANSEKLRQEVNTLKQKSTILCVIGTYDPKLFGIPFVSVSELFDTDQHSLPELLNLNIMNEITKEEYNRLFKNMMFDLDLSFLKLHIPNFIKKLEAAGYYLNKDQKLGVIMHLTSCINRLITCTYESNYIDEPELMNKHKRLYYLLKDSLSVYEKQFEIKFPEVEYCNFIQMIKK